MGDDKEHGKSASDMVQIIVAILGLVGVLGAAVISNWDKLFPQKPSTQVSSEPSETTASSAASRTHLPRLPITALRTKGPLFVVAPPDAEGASIAARILNELQKGGFRVANGRDGAKLLIEIQAPDLGSTQASPIGNLERLSVTTTLTAKMFSSSNGTGDVIPMQRQALGMGATEIEARRNSIAAAADRLGKSIADALQ